MYYFYYDTLVYNDDSLTNQPTDEWITELSIHVVLNVCLLYMITVAIYF